MRTMPLPHPNPSDYFLPCFQPMSPAMKRFCVQLLLAIGVVVVGVNVIHPYPAPMGCRSDLQA
jgi:hypothetical protein